MANTRLAWSMVTPMLLFSCFCLLTGDMVFGYDTGSFGGILGNPGFVNQFGTYDPQTESYAIDPLHTSLLSSLAFIGKFVGCFVAGPAIERHGHRMVFYALSIVSLIGVIIEITAADTDPGSGRLAQFIVGRIIVYISVGLVEVDVTTYQSEIVPASFRGLVVVSLQLFLVAGSLVASGVNKAFESRADGVGWKTVTGIQFIFPVLIIFCTFFIPNSPRWLLSKDRDEDALASLRRLRPNDDTTNGNCEAELQDIREALHEEVHKASWTDLVRGTNLRRTLIVVACYFFQQATGQAFVSTYQTKFYQQNGFADQAYTYPLISSVFGFVAVLIAMYFVDKLGRRYTFIISYAFQTLWMYVLAGLGTQSQKSITTRNTIVAAFMLYQLFYNAGGASIPYLIGAEVPNAAVREKTQSIGTAWNVIWAFVTNFVIPYMMEDIHYGVGWVFGSVSVVALLWTFFFLPETKGQTLEELDAVFAAPYNPFRRADVYYTSNERVEDPKDIKGWPDGGDTRRNEGASV
ncbi:sugar porter family MFS transporter [Aspergillus undulatus]|uniref:sugar porter family MFS transporter n=1 Tax=Aspergillus undulatus TaxID=1810928 RepID=UPI003CCD6725